MEINQRTDLGHQTSDPGRHGMADFGATSRLCDPGGWEEAPSAGPDRLPRVFRNGRLSGWCRRTEKQDPGTASGSGRATGIVAGGGGQIGKRAQSRPGSLCLAETAQRPPAVGRKPWKGSRKSRVTHCHLVYSGRLPRVWRFL